MATAKTVKSIPFATLKVNYLAERNIKADSQEAVNAHKSMRAFIRANKVKLVSAGWKALSDHQHGAPYVDVPTNVATMIVKRKIADKS